MEKPDWVNDNRVRIWNNALTIAFYVFLLSGFAGLFFAAFIRDTANYNSLIAGILFLYIVYEMTVNSYIRVTYLNGNLEFQQTLRKYSLFSRKRNQQIQFGPEEWAEVYCRRYKGGTSYYFRNQRTAAYFVSAEGLNFFYQDLDVLFPQRFKRSTEPLGEIKRNMRRELPERVF